MESTVTLALSGLHCQACVGRVRAALAPHAQEVDVSLVPQQKAVLRGVTSTPQILFEAVASAGAYKATLASPAAVVAISSAIPTRSKAKAVSSKDAPRGWMATYFPLLLLTGFLVFVPVLAQSGQPRFDWHTWMRHFMAGFFLAFAFFKLLDVPAFAKAYTQYDLIAKAWAPWGHVYPFIELGLGAAYLVNFDPTLTNTATLILMSVSLIGVVRAVMKKHVIQCACLGTVFKLPMSTVTILEGAVMVAMAAWMLVAR